MSIPLFKEVQTQLSKFQESDDFCDIILLVDGEKFNCHKVYLAAASEYFKLLFRYDHKREIEIKGVSALAFRNVVSFLYNGKLSDGIEKLKEILIAADLFRISTMKETCGNKLCLLMTEDNAMDMYLLSQTFNCVNLGRTAKCKLVSKAKYWLENNLKDFNDDLMSYFLSSEAPEITEVMAFEALSAWTRMERINRNDKFCKFLPYVRLPMLDKKYFKKNVEKNRHIKKCEQCKVYVTATAKYFANGIGDDLKSDQLRKRGTFDFEDDSDDEEMDMYGGYNYFSSRYPYMYESDSDDPYPYSGEPLARFYRAMF